MSLFDGAGRGVVCLLARAPSAAGKTRLTAGLPPARAHTLRRALFLDTFEAASATGLPVMVCYTPASAREEFQAMLTATDEPSTSSYGGAGLPPSREALRRTTVAWAEAGQPRPNLLPQSTGDLGARMHAAFVDAFALGFDRVALIGSDLPTLPPDHLVRAMQALDRVPMALGAAEDGGYYLVALCAPRAELFDGIAWGSADVLAQTVAVARRLDVAVEVTSTWHDVDAPEDLARVAASNARAHHTRAWLQSEP